MTPPEPGFTTTRSTPALESSLFRTLLEHSAALVTVVNPDGTVRAHTPATCRHLGYPTTTDLGAHPCPDVLWDFVHPDDAPTLRLLDFVQLPPAVTINLPLYRVRHANGTWRWLEGTVVNLTQDPDVGGLLLTATDVTAHVEADHRIRAVVRLAETLLGTRSLNDVLQVILHDALPTLGAPMGGLALLSSDGAHLTVSGSIGYPTWVVEAWVHVPLTVALPMTDAIRERRAIFLTPDDWDTQYPHLRSTRPPALGSAAALPLLGHDGPTGVLTLNFPEGQGQTFSAAQQHFMRSVADLCAHAIERHRTQEDLNTREEGYRTLTRYAADLTTILGPEGTILFETEIATRLLGYPLSDLIGHNALEFVHPDDHANVTSGIRYALTHTGETVQFTYRFRHHDGHWVWLASTGASHTHDPHVRGVLVNSRDVTAQREAEVALTRQQEAFQALFAHNPLPMWVYDHETLDFLEVNDAALRKYGYTRDAFLALKITDVRPPEDVASMLPFLSAPSTQANGTPGRHVTRDGRVVDVITRAHLLTFEGRPAKLVVIEDVTQRLAAERELAASERKFRLLAEHTSNVIATYTPQGVCTYVSPACQAMLGLTPDAFQQAHPLSLVHPDDAECARQFLKDTQAPSFTSAKLVCRARQAEGDSRWVEATIRAIRSPLTGQVLEFQSVAVDIHARKLAEEQLQAQLARAEQFVELTVALEGQVDPKVMAREALERCLRLTEYTGGCYVDIQDGRLTLLHASGCPEDLLSALQRAYPTVEALGAGGARLNAGQVHHTVINHEELCPPLQAPLRFHQGVTALPVMANGQLQGAFLLLTPEAEVALASRKLLRAVAERVGVALERALHLQQLAAAREETLRALGLALEYRDYETKGHTDRVVALSERLGRAMGFEGADLDALRWGAYLHDTGKVAIPDSVLLKPGKLNADEWALMQRHATIGYEMLAHIPNLPPATLEVVLHHHEKWDGSGYPAGLADVDIPLAARVFSVVDVYDALTSDRPYRAAWTDERALAYLMEEAGRQFDPHVVQAFLRLINREPQHAEEAEP